MKIYVVVTGENAITVSLNGEAAVAKTVKPTLTALGNGRIRFQCDGIDEEVETYRNIFINAVPLKGSWIAEEDYLSVTLFEAVMNKTFSGGGAGVASIIAGTNVTLGGTATNPVINATGGSSYLSYVALLSQVDTDAPTALVLANTLGGTVVWSYVDVGIYRGTLSGAFTANKTFVIINNTTSGAFMSAFDVGNTNEIEINILNGDQVAANGMLSLTSIEIRVYP